ncbi:MAG: hypothetical protein ACFFAU_00045 [Candidatus Hodarchaeota archaeon]
MSSTETSDSRAKVICDGPCEICKHQREKDVKNNANEILYYCRNCNQKYLCNQVLRRDRGSNEYQCPSCDMTLSELTIERASQLGLAFGFDIYQTERSKRPIEEIKRTWFYSQGRIILQKDFVHDLIEYESLGIIQLIDILFHSDLQYRPEGTPDKKTLLWDIFSKKPAIIRSIHNSLITRTEHRRVDLVIRALTDNEAFECIYLSSIVPSHIAGTVDLVGVDKKTGGIVWIICQEEKIDEQIISAILNELLSIPPLEFMGVDRIILLTRKWVWMAAEIARRQGRITTRWQRFSIELWEESPLFQYKKI